MKVRLIAPHGDLKKGSEGRVLMALFDSVGSFGLSRVQFDFEEEGATHDIPTRKLLKK